MNLVLDNGNSNIKAGLFEKGELLFSGVYNCDSLADLLQVISSNPVKASILSSVANLPDPLREILSAHGKLLILSEKTSVPISNNYKTPQTLGADRLANAVAATEVFKNSDVLVIDAGTCLKFDFIDKESTYHGGAISPGLFMRYKALNHYTSRLPLLEPVENPLLIGNDTNSSIQSGIINGMTAEINELISEYSTRYPGLRCILTGGDAHFFLNKLKTYIFAAPSLTLQGLDTILRYNQ